MFLLLTLSVSRSDSLNSAKDFSAASFACLSSAISAIEKQTVLVTHAPAIGTSVRTEQQVIFVCAGVILYVLIVGSEVFSCKGLQGPSSPLARSAACAACRLSASSILAAAAICGVGLLFIVLA